MAIVILAHWCPHCQAEVPQLVSWLADNPPPEGVDIVGISTAVNPSQGNYPPSAWLSTEGWTAPTLNDDATLTAYTTLGGTSFPGFVFVTADGAVYLRASGEMDVTEFGAILEQIAP
jgi:thiol-disulfide isomerase/thioredoxin